MASRGFNLHFAEPEFFLKGSFQKKLLILLKNKQIIKKDLEFSPKKVIRYYHNVCFCHVVCSQAVLSNSVMSNSATLQESSLSSPSVHGDSPGKNTGVGCHFLLQGIFRTQGSNPGLLHCRWISHCLSHQGSPTAILSFPQDTVPVRPLCYTEI